MLNGKANPYWDEVNCTLKAIIQEMEKEPAPDWSKIFMHAQDLLALSREALKESQEKNPLP